jgi:hypothetical protein
MLAASLTALVTAVTTGVWAEALLSHTTAGGAGKKLSDLAMSTDMASVLTGVNIATTSIPAITTAIWAEALASHTTAGGAGKKLSDITATTVPDAWGVALPGAYTTAQAGGIVSAIRTASSQIELATTTLPLEPAGSSNFTALMTSTGSTAMADAVWARNSEATESYGGQIRLIRAASAGVSTGGGTPAISFFSPTTTITRIAATVTTDGNRTAVTVTT